MKKRLIFHFYYCKDKNRDVSYQMHFLGLSKYIHIFNDVEFYISLDDTSDYDTIKKIEYKLLSLGIRGNVSFHVVKNNLFCEAQTFYDAIATRLDEYDGITFFAHNKGLTNKKNENLIYWLSALYFFNLETIEEVDDKIKNGRVTYGNPAVVNEHGKIHYTKYPWCNSVGTFYWINGRAFKNLLDINNAKIKPLSDRYYAETFVANFFDNSSCFGYHNYKGTNMHDFYNEGKQCIEIIYKSSPFWDDFMKFCNQIASIKESNFIELT